MIEAKNDIDVSKFDSKRVTGAVQGGHTGKYFQGWTHQFKEFHKYTEKTRFVKSDWDETYQTNSDH